jgi:serine/threonine-protein kinase
MTVNPSQPQAYGHYEVERLLGRGAMGTVYVARDRRIGRRVALKTIRIAPGQFADEEAESEFFGRLQREAEVSGSLLHPNIVTLYEVGYDENRISYLAMELVEGETLLAAMKRRDRKPAPVDEVLRVAEDVLRALAHAHARGIIHRDIKPANILVAADGTAKLADFGIARSQDSSITAAGALIGTPNYMAPEQVLGKTLTTQADMFSLGVVLYEMLTGVKPFASTELTAILHNITRQDAASAAELNANVPREVSDLIARMMAKSPDARPSSPAALDAVIALRKGEAPVPASFIETIPSFPLRPPVPWWRRRIRPLYAVLVIAGVLAVAAIPTARIASRIDSSPTVTIPQAQLDEFRNKREALRLAAAAFDAGQYGESVKRYDAYLAKYPHSSVAREGRERAEAALAGQQRPAPVRVASQSPPKPKPKPKEEEDISPRELLRRIRKTVFRR